MYSEQQAAYVRVERLIELLLGDLPELAEFVNPGIYRQHIDMPDSRCYNGVDAVEVGEVGDIALNRCGIAADCGDCLMQFVIDGARQ